MATRIGIDGFGRIGRCVLRAGWKNPDLEFVGINDLTDITKEVIETARKSLIIGEA